MMFIFQNIKEIKQGMTRPHLPNAPCHLSLGLTPTRVSSVLSADNDFTFSYLDSVLFRFPSEYYILYSRLKIRNENAKTLSRLPSIRAKMKWPIIILLTLTFVAAAGKLKLLLSVAIISNYSLIIIRRWRPHIITSGTHTAAPLDSQLLLFYIWQFGLRSGPNSFSEREVLIQFIRSRHTPLSNLYRPVNKRQKKIMLELQ